MAGEFGQAQVRSFRMLRHRLLGEQPGTSVPDVARVLCGVHAQLMSSAELQVCARSGCCPADVARALWTDRTVVKTWCMRGTLHLVAAEDVPLFGAALCADFWETNRAVALGWVTRDELALVLSVVDEALDGRALTREELQAAVASRAGQRLGELVGGSWGGLLKQASRCGRLCFGPNRGRNVTFVRPDQWLPTWTRWDEDAALVELLRRYLSIHGPCLVQDFEAWTGLGRATVRRAWAGLEPELAPVAVDGRHAWVLARDAGALEAAGASAAVRLLPAFDVYVLGHRSRDHLVGREFFRRVSRAGGWISPVVLVAGAIAGTWAHTLRRRQLQVEVEAFQPLGAATRRGIEAEAGRLARWLDAEGFGVQVQAPGRPAGRPFVSSASDQP